MIHLLAQVIAATEPSQLHFEIEKWIPTGREVFRGAVIGAGILVVGFVLLGGLRKYIVRTRLGAAAVVMIVSLALYFGIGLIKPDRMLDRADYATIWLTRIFAAAVLFSALRVFDRLLIVPILTRGGKVPVQRFIHQIVNIVVACFAILGFGAWAFGWDIDKFLAGSAVVSIVLGLALQETLGNFFSGLVMQASSPFAIGDWITCAGVEGRVVDMTWRAVTIHTLEDNHVILPNGTVAKEQIVNYHVPTTATARKVSVGLEYALAPGQAVSVLRAAALETHGVSAKPEPFVYLDSFADSAIVYVVKFWITEPAAHLKIEHAVRSNIWYRLREKGYSIPFPIRTVEHVPLDKKAHREGESAAQSRYESIRDLWMFQPLTDEQKHALANGATDVLLAAGQALFRQGDAGSSLFVIRSGEVEVLARHGDGPETKVATLKAGDFFGEMSALTGQPRSATIRAATELACVQIGKEDLSNVFAADGQIMEKISRIIAERNVERQNLTQQAATDAAKAEIVETQQKSLLDRMLSFFKGN